MKKLKSIMAFILASGLCSVMTACGDSTENSTSESESSVSVSSAEENSIDESSEEPTTEAETTTEEATTTEEVTTTEETTTEEPTTEAKKEFTQLVADGETVSLDILEQVVPSIYGMPIDEAAEAVMTALNFRTDNKEISDTPAKEMTYTPPEGYTGRITYNYDVSDCNLNIFDCKCEFLILNAYYNDDSGYTYGFGFVFDRDATINVQGEEDNTMFDWISTQLHNRYYDGYYEGWDVYDLMSVSGGRVEYNDVYIDDDIYMGNISMTFPGEMRWGSGHTSPYGSYVFIEDGYMVPDIYGNYKE